MFIKSCKGIEERFIDAEFVTQVVKAKLTDGTFTVRVEIKGEDKPLYLLDNVCEREADLLIAKIGRHKNRDFCKRDDMDLTLFVLNP